jgi:hypothetical protein
VTVGKDKLQGGRCIVPATMFAEPDRNTSKPVVNRWFGRADGTPFFFAGIKNAHLVGFPTSLGLIRCPPATRRWECKAMTDDNALAILADIAADPTIPPLMRIEAEAASAACKDHGISTCREVIALLIGMLSETEDKDERPEKLS